MVASGVSANTDASPSESQLSPQDALFRARHAASAGRVVAGRRRLAPAQFLNRISIRDHAHQRSRYWVGLTHSQTVRSARAPSLARPTLGSRQRRHSSGFSLPNPSPLMQWQGGPASEQAKETLIPTFQVLDSAGSLVEGLSDEVVKDIEAIPREQALKMYDTMLLLPIMDNILYNAQRQGRLSFYMTSYGEEAAVVCSAAAWAPTDPVFAQYRESGVLLYRGFGLDRLMNQNFANRLDKATKGRQMGVHLGSAEHHFITISSPLATQIPQAAGAAYAIRRMAQRGEAAGEVCVICYLGEGAASEGDAWAGLSMAAVLGGPSVFVVRQNGFAISTPTSSQFAGDGIAARGPALGIESIRCDGNDPLAVYLCAREARRRSVSTSRPTLVEILTYRVGHHSTSDDSSAYRNREDVESIKKQSPIDRFQAYLRSRGWLAREAQPSRRDQLKQDVLKALGDAEKELKPRLGLMFEDVYQTQPAHLQSQRAELDSHIRRWRPEGLERHLAADSGARRCLPLLRVLCRPVADAVRALPPPESDSLGRLQILIVSQSLRHEGYRTEHSLRASLRGTVVQTVGMLPIAHEEANNDSAFPRRGQAPLATDDEDVPDEFHSYELDVVQNPVRARMAGFGDRDRRPLTPPLVAELTVRDSRTQRVLDPASVDLSFFIVAADLWSADGQHDENLVLHPSFSPTLVVREASPLPRPAMPLPEAQWQPQASTSASPYEEAPNRQIPRGMVMHAEPSPVWQHMELPDHRAPLPIWSGWSAAPYQADTRPAPPRPVTSRDLYPHPPLSTSEALPRSRPQTAGDRQAFCPVEFSPLVRESNEIVSVRNLTGSLHANASLLRNEHGRLGIYFIFSDLSVRTEGKFTIRLVFMRIGLQGRRHEYPQPLLVQAYTRPFSVLSAKKFGGMLPPTALSLAFSRQGLKIANRRNPTSRRGA
ncbi:uncharacterized protein L969DRAFT_95822 [Mixia osmundae IAM 14324]|uniref:Velvet domain-containing protein n=1 Tax=Mixia osmundae (strain CBS 9802 / IAM 14324 / JCM 22182 / KY 12970) TaxID=764103 RepID=G7DSG7_MIXOS|nr:uncharacterized protein L969DRAFT_95822 [Mixia osmundae IAM 14324]KEI37978.1 hypothetical protein L969DRAFT_95822 [Mixia osmundae IAM 14324]GAA93527.1 hypothetical protein E5Q_00168 [Mixia osmundae IAM 14324]